MIFRSVVLALLLSCFYIVPAQAEKICVPRATVNLFGIGLIPRPIRVPDNRKCNPLVYYELLNTQELRGETGARGETGPAGKDGKDGSIKVWGDGSDGDLVVRAGQTVVATPGRQYHDIIVESGAILTIPHGTKLLCTGSAAIDGQVKVRQGSHGGFIGFPLDLSSSNYYSLTVETPGAGAASKPARAGEIVAATGQSARGSNTFQYPFREEYSSNLANLRPSVTTAGGGGAGALNNFGGDGGGSAGIYCHDGIHIGQAGILSADGDVSGVQGAGAGGAGGLIVLASAAFVCNEGMITANGGVGGRSSGVCAPGGGGGGGVVNLIAPDIAAGTIQVNGGLGGFKNSIGIRSNEWKCGGAEGGSLGGLGGLGGDIIDLEVQGPGNNGNPGQIFKTISADPTALLF